MVFKASCMIIAAIFLGQSSVLAAPVVQNSQVNPTRSDLFKAEGHPIISDLTDQEGDSCGNFGKKGNHSSLSDSNCRGPFSRFSGSRRSDEVQYPGAKPYSVDKIVVKDPRHTDGLGTTYPVDHSGGALYGKKIKSVDGTISDPTYPDDPNRSTDDPLSECNHGENSTKLVDGTTSDSSSIGYPYNITNHPVRGDDEDRRSSANPAKGTVSDAEGRQGHTPTGKPCIVPSSFQEDTLPYGGKNTSYLGGHQLNCTLDVMQKFQDIPNVSNMSKGTHPYTFGNGDDTDRSI